MFWLSLVGIVVVIVAPYYIYGAGFRAGRRDAIGPPKPLEPGARRRRVGRGGYFID